MDDPKRWTPVAVIVAMLTASICLVLFTAVLTPVVTGRDLSEEGSVTIRDMLLAIVAIVSVWVGSQARK